MSADERIDGTLSAAHRAVSAPERVIPLQVKKDKHRFAMGPVYAIDTSLPAAPRHVVPDDQRAAEQNRLNAAYAALAAAYDAAMKVAPTEKARQAITIEKFSMYDRTLTGPLKEAIASGMNAEQAVETIIPQLHAKYAHKTDNISRAYATYILNIGRGLRLELGDDDFKKTVMANIDLSRAPPGSIIVMPFLGIQELPTFYDHTGKPKFPAMINSEGSETDHPNIVLDARGVIIGRIARNELAQLQTGQVVVMDEALDVVIVDPSSESQEKYRTLIAYQTLINNILVERSQKEDRHPTMTLGGGLQPPQAVQVYANITGVRDIEALLEVNAAGVGLYRTEMAVFHAKNGDIPTADVWYAKFREIAAKLDGRKFIVRTVDFEGDKGHERFSPEQRQAIICDQMRAALRVAHEFGHDRIDMMIPLIESAEHLEQFQNTMNAEAAKLGLKPIHLGSMYEVPTYAEEMAMARSKFFSTGSNDLTTSLLDIDRFDGEAQSRIDPTMPAILKALGAPFALAKPDGTLMADAPPASICGKLASEPRFFALLAGLGYRNFSVGIADVPIIKEMARRVDPALAAHMVGALKQTSHREEREYILDHFNEVYMGLKPDGTLSFEAPSRKFAYERPVMPVSAHTPHAPDSRTGDGCPAPA